MQQLNEAHAGRIDSWIYHTESEYDKNCFNEWGRPERGHWSDLQSDLGVQVEQVAVEATPSMIAKRVAKVARAEGWREQSVALGIVDSELSASLSLEFSEAPTLFNPAVNPQLLQEFLYPLELWGKLAEDSLSAFEEWVALPRLEAMTCCGYPLSQWLAKYQGRKDEKLCVRFSDFPKVVSREESELYAPIRLWNEWREVERKEGSFALIRTIWNALYPEKEKARSVG